MRILNRETICVLPCKKCKLHRIHRRPQWQLLNDPWFSAMPTALKKYLLCRHFASWWLKYCSLPHSCYTFTKTITWYIRLRWTKHRVTPTRTAPIALNHTFRTSVSLEKEQQYYAVVSWQVDWMQSSELLLFGWMGWQFPFQRPSVRQQF